MAPRTKLDRAKSPKPFWDQFIIILLILNTVFVIFNLSYLPLRDFYINHVPGVTSYDLIKGIEPHPQTEAYLEAYDSLVQLVHDPVAPKSQIKEVIQDLKQQSLDLIDEDPFVTAGKSVSFAKAKQTVSHQLGLASAKQAFKTFWSYDYLDQIGWEQALAFFHANVWPLLHTNYYRSVDAMGQAVDHFWWIDLPFTLIFVVDFLQRTLAISRRDLELSWWDAMMRRWYDVLLWIPIWRWLRLIPVTARLHQAGWVNFKRILSQLTYEPAVYLADRTSIFMMVRLFNQAQDSIQQGELLQVLLPPAKVTTITDPPNQLQQLISHLSDITICKVLPDVQPELKQLVQHTLEGSLKASAVYQSLEQVPGLDSTEIMDQLSHYLAQVTYDLIVDSYTDAQGQILLNQLSQRFYQVLYQELQQEVTQKQIQSALLESLASLKVKFAEGSQSNEPEKTLSEADRLHSMADLRG